MADEWSALLSDTLRRALAHLAAIDTQPVARPVTMTALTGRFPDRLAEQGISATRAIGELCDNVADGLVVTNAGRYFGFVEGGVLPAALAADWLTATWDQNAAFHALSPAAAAVEEVCRRWLLDLFGLPADASAGFTGGAQLANVIGLAAGRHRLLADRGWDVETRGLTGAPPLTVLAGESRHATIDRALRLLGIGTAAIVPVPADAQGRIRTDEFAAAVAGRRGDGPLLVCAQVGNVNSGACDPVGEICRLAHDAGAWVHVDGAFGLWAAAVPSLRHLVEGVAAADSWAVDAHKWLNVPYDSAMVFCADPAAHRAAMTLSADYLTSTGHRNGADWTPESSRRTRAFAVWAALRTLGRAGVAELVGNACRAAREFARLLGAVPEVSVLNDVVLNQVLVRIGDSDERTAQVAADVQAGGVIWLGTTLWHGQRALRISVSDHATGPEQVRAAAAAIADAVR